MEAVLEVGHIYENNHRIKSTESKPNLGRTYPDGGGEETYEGL